MKKLLVVIPFLFSMNALATDPQDASNAGVAAVTMSPIWTVAGPFISTTEGLNSNEQKVVLEAKEDAATFVATDGSTRGVRLTRALELLRKANPKLPGSDMELATLIMSL